MLSLPPSMGGRPCCGCRGSTIRLDSSDYSVHPSAVGRHALLRSDLDRVRVCVREAWSPTTYGSGARHQTISDPAHVKAAQLTSNYPPQRKCRADRSAELRQPYLLHV